MTSEEKLTSTILEESQRMLDEGCKLIEHCMQQLNLSQIWWRPDDSMNAIGNLMLHLCGNVTQWIICGLGTKPDERDRPAEFSEREQIPKELLLQKLKETASEAKRVMADQTAETLLLPRTIQGFQVTGLGAIFHSLSHWKGHVQEIVCLTRMQLGDRYQFHFVIE